MITYEQDPDVVRWGLQLFDGDPYSGGGYYGSVTQNNNDYYSGYHLRGYDCGSDCNESGNNDYILNNLHEDMSQLSVSEPIKSFQEGAIDHSQMSAYSQEWMPQSLGNYSYGIDNFYKERTELENTSSSCSSPDGESYPENWSYSIDQDKYSLGGKVEERLNQMVPIPVSAVHTIFSSDSRSTKKKRMHIPKINGEIPSIDEATLDHQRLLDRLQVYELVEFKVPGDGNCQFRALSDQFYRTPEHHKFVRRQVVNQLKSSRDKYASYVPMAYDQYLKKMSKSGEWGDHVTLQAAADSYGVKLFVITSFKDTCYIEILPSVQKSERVIFLSFWAEVHYNSIYPEGECPSFRTKRKKRWLVDQHEPL